MQIFHSEHSDAVRVHTEVTIQKQWNMCHSHQAITGRPAFV